MPQYVDGFVLTVPKKKLPEYRALATLASKVWLEHGALDYRECVGEDMKVKMGIPFTKLANVKRTDVVIFAWIVYNSRKHRDSVNAKVMKDPRLGNMDPASMPFDCSKMTYGGFDTIVHAAK